MSAEHTSGPWAWDADKVKGDPFGRVRYRVVARGKTITQVYYSSYEGGPTNAEADARLIAAAPKLLSVLKQIQRIGYTDFGDRLMVDEAIALATGGRP